jgi:hypothetical protein
MADNAIPHALDHELAVLYRKLELFVSRPDGRGSVRFVAEANDLPFSDVNIRTWKLLRVESVLSGTTHVVPPGNRELVHEKGLEPLWLLTGRF